MLSLTAYLFCCLAACSGHRKVGEDELVCRPMKVEGGYGYMLISGDDTLIYQPFIPSLPGRRPFATKEDAMKVGRLMYDKMYAGEMPSLSVEEVEQALRSK